MAEEGRQRVGGKLAGLPKTLRTHAVAIAEKELALGRGLAQV